MSKPKPCPLIHATRLSCPGQYFDTPRRDRAGDRGRRYGCWSRTKHGAGHIGSVAGECQVLLDQPLRQHLDGDEPDLAALALHPKVQHALTALHVLYPQAAGLLAADAMIE